MPSLAEYYARVWASTVLQLQKTTAEIGLSSMRGNLSPARTVEPVVAEEKDFEERIRSRAYDIWLREGRPEGRDKEHWERAKAEIEKERRERQQ